MELTTWTIYNGKNLRDINNEVLVKEEFPFLLLRPDVNHGNEFLGLAIVDQFVASIVVDLVNRELTPEQLTTIFQDKMGLVSGENLSEYQTAKTNFSKTPILQQNIQNLMETYNILVKAKPITFQIEDYATNQQVKANQGIFLELDFQKMPMHQLVNAINSGLPDFYKRLEELRNPQLNNEARNQKILEMSGLQTNLIFFLEQTVKKMDQLIGEQQQKITALENQQPPPDKDKNE